MDISIVLNAHREGCLAHPTVLSLLACQAHAHARGVSTEVIVVQDNADADTLEYFRCHGDPGWRFEQTNFADLGQARNHGVACASGRFTAFLDADDLFSVNWLSSAFEAACKESRTVAWHPEINVYFGNAERVFYHADMDDEGWTAGNIVAANYWTALVFSATELLRTVPYPPSDLAHQIGYEDWAWNEATIAMGVVHKTVPGTAHFIRVKRQGSLLAQTNGLRSVPRPAGLVAAVRAGTVSAA